MAVVGVVLAGGAARRMGGEKATSELDGVALLLHPLRALTAVTPRQAVVAKAATHLPPLPPGVARWDEPATPQHPLTGILHALRCAGGPVLCCALDLPLLDAATLQRLLDADPGDATCVVPVVSGRTEPLCALWLPDAAPRLAELPADVAMRDALHAVGALEVPYADARPFVNVNTPAELRAIRR